MSDVSQGPGWWQASDGKWYPPETHPDYRPPTIAPTPVAPVAPAVQAWTAAPQSAAAARPGKTRWMLIGGGVMVLVVIAVFAVVAIVGSNAAVTASTLPTGPGTATVTWTRSTGYSAHPPPTPFSGTAAGISFSGTATPPNYSALEPRSGATATIPSILPVGTWKGTFGGTSFDLNVDMSTAGLSSNATTLSITVNGTFGNQPVRITAHASEATGNRIDFTGTIGNMTVSGSTSVPSGNGAARPGTTATFTISK